MGLSMGISRSSYDGALARAAVNPDPSCFKWLQWEQVGKYCVLLVHYKGCTTYEGQKILVFEAEIAAVRAQKVLDPHFSESNEYLSPVARFEPTVTGWKNAITFCKAIE